MSRYLHFIANAEIFRFSSEDVNIDKSNGVAAAVRALRLQKSQR